MYVFLAFSVIIIIIIIIINENISVAFSPKTARTRNTQKDDMFGRQRKKQEAQQAISMRLQTSTFSNVIQFSSHRKIFC